MPENQVLSGVKFTPPSFEVISAAVSADFHRENNAYEASPVTIGSADSVANCNWRGPRKRRTYVSRIQQAGIIRTGPLVGLPMRPRTDRTKAISFTQGRHLVNALGFADSRQRPLNAELTIVWRHSLEWRGPTCWSHFQTRLLDETSRWLKRKDIEPTFIWTRETVQGNGPHTHIQIYLGRQPTLVRNDLVAWLSSKFQFARNGVNVSCGKFGAQTEKMRRGLLRYILKGIDHRMFRYIGSETSNIASDLGIKDRGQQGTVKNKRAGSSQNIALAARKANGWREVREIPALARMIVPELE